MITHAENAEDELVRTSAKFVRAPSAIARPYSETVYRSTTTRHRKRWRTARKITAAASAHRAYRGRDHSQLAAAHTVANEAVQSRDATISAPDNAIESCASATQLRDDALRNATALFRRGTVRFSCGTAPFRHVIMQSERAVTPYRSATRPCERRLAAASLRRVRE